MKYAEEGARHVVIDQIMTHVHNACPYPSEHDQEEWDNVIEQSMATSSLDLLKGILGEWQDDAGSKPL